MTARSKISRNANVPSEGIAVQPAPATTEKTHLFQKLKRSLQQHLPCADTHHRSSAQIPSADYRRNSSTQIPSADFRHISSAMIPNADSRYISSAMIPSADSRHISSAQISNADSRHISSAQIHNADSRHISSVQTPSAKPRHFSSAGITPPQIPKYQDKFVGIPEVFGLPASFHDIPLPGNLFYMFLGDKDAVMVFFYDHTDPKSQQLRPTFRKAAQTTQRDNHAYAAIDCQYFPEICDNEAVGSTPLFKLYSRAREVGVYDDETTAADLKKFVETAPVHKEVSHHTLPPECIPKDK